MCVSVGIWTWRRSRAALATIDTGGTSADPKFVLLPAYQLVLYIFVGMSLLNTINGIIQDMVIGDEQRLGGVWHAVTAGVWHGLLSAFNEGIAMLLMQHSMGAK